MYSHVRPNHHIPTEAQTREQQEEQTNRQTRKDVQLHFAKEDARECQIMWEISEQADAGMTNDS